MGQARRRGSFEKRYASAVAGDGTSITEEVCPVKPTILVIEDNHIPCLLARLSEQLPSEGFIVIPERMPNNSFTRELSMPIPIERIGKKKFR